MFPKHRIHPHPFQHSNFTGTEKFCVFLSISAEKLICQNLTGGEPARAGAHTPEDGSATGHGNSHQETRARLGSMQVSSSHLERDSSELKAVEEK